jgi:hypothetical protein
MISAADVPPGALSAAVDQYQDGGDASKFHGDFHRLYSSLGGY